MDGEGGGYINTNVNLKTVKEHMWLILTHLFLLWTLRSLVSSRADYNNPDRTVLAFENWTFLWSNESLINFLRRRPFIRIKMAMSDQTRRAHYLQVWFSFVDIWGLNSTCRTLARD